jgi:N-acetylated-alpha-linked acidic dipeptidase
MVYDQYFLALLAASVAHGCQHDRHAKNVHEIQSRLQKRQTEAFPPVLGAEESILSGSVDNMTIDSWSYYYTHGLHWAGTNKSMAEWTADHWSSYGFESDLATYCKFENC